MIFTVKKTSSTSFYMIFSIIVCRVGYASVRKRGGGRLLGKGAVNRENMVSLQFSLKAF